MKDLPEPPPKVAPASPSADNAPSSSLSTSLFSVVNGQPAKDVHSTDKIAAKKSGPIESQSVQYPEQSPPRRKKSVTFAKDTKETDSKGPRIGSFASREPSAPCSSDPLRNGQMNRGRNRPASPETVDKAMASPVTPIKESPEDAVMRRQMLYYNLNEVGAIVAEMDLEETDSSESYSEDSDDDYGSTTDEEEDQFGRTTKRVVDDDYRQQMMELERKLNAKMLVNVGPNPDIPKAVNTDHKEDKTDEHTDGRPITTKRENEDGEGKKGVRFADELDVQKLPQLAPTSDEQAIVLENVSRPVSDTIIERAGLPTGSNATASTPKKVSKFKTSRSPGVANGVQGRKDPRNVSHDVINGPLTGSGLPLPPTPASSKQKDAPIPIPYATEVRSRKVPEGPPGMTHAEVLVERPTLQTEEEVAESDEFDPALMQQELAVEYHRMRNRMIQRNGGFMRDEKESEQISLSEDGDGEGGGRKISKFKAARLGRLSQ